MSTSLSIFKKNIITHSQFLPFFIHYRHHSLFHTNFKIIFDFLQCQQIRWEIDIEDSLVYIYKEFFWFHISLICVKQVKKMEGVLVITIFGQKYKVLAPLKIVKNIRGFATFNNHLLNFFSSLSIFVLISFTSTIYIFSHLLRVKGIVIQKLFYF